MSVGFVLFSLGGQRFAVELSAVREVVRWAPLRQLPGVHPPVQGLLMLRGLPLPVCDVRSDRAAPARDVLVLDTAGQPVGLVADEVLAVEPGGFGTESPAPAGLPGYVTGMRESTGGTVLVVDPGRLLAA